MFVDPVGQASSGRRAAPEGVLGRLPPALSLILDTALIALVISAVAVWPAVAACRSTAQTYGFHAGDSLTTCIRRGTRERLARAERRIARAEHRLQVMRREAGL